MKIGNDSWKSILFYSVTVLSLSIILHGYFISSSNPKIGSQLKNEQNSDGSQYVSIKNAPVWGRADAPVTIIEFSDFDCTFCKKAYDEILPELKKNYIDKGKVKFVYRNMPLQIHTNAKLKAVAALCAKEMKGDTIFYLFHNQLFANEDRGWDVNEELIQIAKTLDLNIPVFQQCLKQQKLYDQVDLDIADAIKMDASGTPSWFIGKTNNEVSAVKGIKVVGSQPFSVFRILIDELLTE